WANRQNGTQSHSEHFFRHRAQQQLLERAPSVSAKNRKVNIITAHHFYKYVGYGPLANERVETVGLRAPFSDQFEYLLARPVSRLLNHRGSCFGSDQIERFKANH